jgi:hypothetical protein
VIRLEEVCIIMQQRHTCSSGMTWQLLPAHGTTGWRHCLLQLLQTNAKTLLLHSPLLCRCAHLAANAHGATILSTFRGSSSSDQGTSSCQRPWA